jgi:hypothetical protein
MLVAFSDGDPITGGMAPIFQREMAGAQGIEWCGNAATSFKKTPARSSPGTSSPSGWMTRGRQHDTAMLNVRL